MNFSMTTMLTIAFIPLVILNVLSFSSIYCLNIYNENNRIKYNIYSMLLTFIACLVWLLLLLILSLLQLSPMISFLLGIVYLIPQTIYHFIKRKNEEDKVKTYFKEKVSVVMGLLVPIIIIAYLLKPVVAIFI